MRVLVVTNLRVYREGLALALRRHDGFDAIEVAAPFEDLAAPLSLFRPSVVLMDLVDARMLDVARMLARDWPGLRIVGIGVGQGDPEILTCAEAGIHGMVSHDASLEELIDTIDVAMRGEFRCSARVAGAMVRRLAAIRTNHVGSGPHPSLTGRQTDIVRCLEAGLSNKEIARRLGIQPGTVKSHVHVLLEKLGAARRSEAVARLRRAGWFNSGFS